MFAILAALVLRALLVHAAVTLREGGEANGKPLPVVLWHGMGDNCCNPDSIGKVKSLIETELGPNSYVKSLMIGKTPEEDTKNGFLLNANIQVDMVCDQLASDDKLKDGFNAVGFSQGGQFLRAYVERCNSPPIHALVSLGGQHQGISGIPHCEGQRGLCGTLQTLLNFGAYTPFVQQHLGPAGYWHDHKNEDEYREKCTFLPDINNERDAKNDTYKANLKTLKKFVMVKFLNDTMVVPKESTWFGWYKADNDTEMVTLEETELYKQDWLGLQWLDKKGRLVYVSVEGDHLEFDDDWFLANIVRKHLA